MRALITGITGFAGSHLADYLLEHVGAESVFGVGLPTDSTHNIQHIESQITLYRVDLTDYEAVEDVVASTTPDHIFHLAAQASVERAWKDPAGTLVNNITAQLNILRAVVACDMAPKILAVGSADEYGLVATKDLPASEDTPLRPLNPYAVSKIAQDYLGYQYFLSHGLYVVRVRPFNHTGPRQGTGFVVPDFCRQIVMIENGRQEPVMRVGNLSAQRDFTDVRDVVRAYHLALAKGEPGRVYNVGSSRAYSIRHVLDMLLSLSEVEIRVEQDPERMRPSDVPVLVCDTRHFARTTGWESRYRLEQTLRDTLAYWRERVAEE
ncbi:MAG: GDP-mannose 4,6-dehydratase [Chloroflexota bacterium]